VEERRIFRLFRRWRKKYDPLLHTYRELSNSFVDSAATNRPDRIPTKSFDRTITFWTTDRTSRLVRIRLRRIPKFSESRIDNRTVVGDSKSSNELKNRRRETDLFRTVCTVLPTARRKRDSFLLTLESRGFYFHSVRGTWRGHTSTTIIEHDRTYNLIRPFRPIEQLSGIPSKWHGAVRRGLGYHTANDGIDERPASGSVCHWR